MARILCLAASGFGKSTSIGSIPELNIRGLSPNNSYVISTTSKPLPFKGSKVSWPVAPLTNLKAGRRVITNKASEIVSVLDTLRESPVHNVILDDFNYIMQDWYMNNALRTGWDAPKQIGVDMGKIFAAIEKYQDLDKNIIVLAHGEDIAATDGSGRKYTKMKTTGKMVDEYVTPEGKFDVTLVGRSKYDSGEKKVVKLYTTNEDEFLSSPKSPHGMFSELYIPNDLGMIVEAVDNYYAG